MVMDEQSGGVGFQMMVVLFALQVREYWNTRFRTLDGSSSPTHEKSDRNGRGGVNITPTTGLEFGVRVLLQIRTRTVGESYYRLCILVSEPTVLSLGYHGP